MVGKRPSLVLSVLAAAAILETQAIGYDGNVASAGATAYGFADTDAASGDMLAIDVQGTTVAKSGAAIAVGAALEVGTSGKVITKNTGVTVARALTAATGADELIEVLIIHS